VRHLHHFITGGVERILVRLLPTLQFSIPIPEVAIVCDSNSALHVEYVFSGVKKGCSFKPSISDVLDLKNLLILSLVFSLFDEVCFMI
jgi:hypothetical protein